MSEISRAQPSAAAGVPASPGTVAGLTVAAALGGTAALWLPMTAGAVALAVLGVLIAFYDRRRSGRILAAGLLASALLLGLAPPLVEHWATGEDLWRQRVETAYEELWQGLETSAAKIAAGLVPPGDARMVQQTFDQLQRLAATPAFEQRSILLLDPGGGAVAWAGEGLLHQLEAEALPTEGTTFRRSLTAASLLAVAPLAAEGRAWRLVVGHSFPSDRWPFPGLASRSAPWSVVAAYAVDETAAEGALALQRGDWPTLLLTWPPPSPDTRVRSWLRRLAALVLTLALALIALLESRTTWRTAAWAGERPWPIALACLLVAWVAAASRAAAVAAPLAWVLVAAAALAAAGLLSRPRRLPAWAIAIAGAAGALALAVLALALQRVIGRQELSAAFTGAREVVALRLAWFLVSLGLAALALRLGRSRAGDGTGWLAVALLAAAAAAHDAPALAWPLLAIAGAALAVWLAGRPVSPRPATLAVLLLLVAALAATSWELAYRQVLRETLAERDLPRLAPPTSNEQHAIFLELHRYFEQIELTTLLPFGDAEVDFQDLAFALWRHSPLALRDGLSALVIEPDDRLPLVFSFDLPLDAERRNLVWERLERLGIPPTEAWRSRLIEGEIELRRHGQPWGRGRYYFLPRLGFRLGVSEIEELETALLRGQPHHRPVDGLPAEASYALYRPDGSVLWSLWRQAPSLEPELIARPSGRLDTTAGRVWYAARPDPGGVAVIYLPILGTARALSRVAIHTCGSLALIAALLAAALTLVPWSSWRGALLRIVRSYSRRLLLVYTLLLFLPLVALNLVLLRDFEERQRQQQLGEGEAALASARTLLSGFFASGEGFIFDDAFLAPVLNYISSVVHHQVNVYWQGRLLSSSQQALFTAGLLPGRIPGDIYTHLILRGHDFASRDRDGGEVAYLEIYAPVRLGEGTDFVLSVSMLEQQGEAARELATMRRQAVLVSGALFALLLALGGRLARGFTTPLQELVEGTRRIAAGARSLELAPRELELAALVRAIDEMALRIAEGREKLVREKQVVERMVENITSGVVSLDRERRVLLHNRVAKALLGSEIGQPIDRALAQRPYLAPVYEFVAAGEAGREQTVRLPAGAAVAMDSSAPPAMPVSGAVAEPREWTLTWVPVPGGSDPAALLVVDDDTEVLRGQRLAAWAEMARIIAHEIKNPLTPIRLSTEHMREVYQRDPKRFGDVFERCTANVLKQVEELRVIASEFSTYSRIPRAELRRADLVTEMEELLAAYQDVEPLGVAFSFHHPEEPVPARIDPNLLRRAVRNLLENALRASTGAGRGRVELAVDVVDGGARIRVADRGPGVPADTLSRIFEPYFSTHETGTGLGLPIARRIVEQHGGTIAAHNRPGGGLEVVITMPISEEMERTIEMVEQDG